jgi:hypothetical protein
MARAYPAEFRNDVVAVARKHEASISQIAKDFGLRVAPIPKPILGTSGHRFTHLNARRGGFCRARQRPIDLDHLPLHPTRQDEEQHLPKRY